MGKLKRVKLNVVYKNGVIANGYGAMLGKFRVGKVVGHNRNAVKVSFNDKDGNFTEFFHIKTGIRIDDLGQSSGWRVSPSDWEIPDISFLPVKSTEKNAKGKTRMVKIHNGKYPIEHVDGNTQELSVEVWKDNEIGGLYIRTCRIVQKEDSIRTKQVPALVPFSVLTKVLDDFKNEK